MRTDDISPPSRPASFLIDVPAPSMGATVSELAVVALHVAAGGRVSRGSPVATLESDKSLFEFESPCDGIVRAVFANVGEARAVGLPLLRIETADLSQEHLRVTEAPGSTAADEAGGRAGTFSARFSFGRLPLGPDFTLVPPEAAFDPGRGFGFERAAAAAAVQRAAAPSRETPTGFVTADKPFRFSIAVPEGSYHVTMMLGDAEGMSVTTVKAETRRLMIEKVATGHGQFAERTITVNVRNSRISGMDPDGPDGDSVRLKQREKTAGGFAYHWDGKLTLEFGNSRPCLCWLEIRRAAAVTTLYLAGDSTVSDEPNEPLGTWGQMLPRFFGPGISVANHAAHGETLKSYITELRLAKVLSQLSAGDYLFIQFGHGDQKRHRPHTFSEAGSTYKAYLKVFVAEARLRGATPVLVTPVQRLIFDADGKIHNTLGDYPDAMRAVAAEERVALIDLCAMSMRFFEALGSSRAPFAFFDLSVDQSHHSAYGGYELAKCVVEGVRRLGLGLEKHLLPEVTPFDPDQPDPPEEWSLPASPPC